MTVGLLPYGIPPPPGLQGGVYHGLDRECKAFIIDAETNALGVLRHHKRMGIHRSRQPRAA
eukprot:3746064-Pyramimonas_sp.AAC.1